MTVGKRRGPARRLGGLVLLLFVFASGCLSAATRTEPLSRARRYLAEGNLEAAARFAREEALVHPEDGESWRLLGTIALQRGDLPQAERDLERAMRLAGRNPEAASLLAILWRREGRFRDAADLLRRLGEEAEADQLAGFGKASPFLQRGPDDVRLDWAGSGLRPVVRVLVAGKRWANFLIDTGASCVVLDRRLADEIGLPPVGSAQLLGAGAKTASGKLGRLDSLRLGATEVRNIPVVVIDLHRSGKLLEPFDGILGSEFLQHFVVILDYPKRQLSLHKARRGSSESDLAGPDRRVADVPLRLTPGGLVVVPMEVPSGGRVLLFLDTGAEETSLALSRRAAVRLGIAPLGRGDRYLGVGGRYLASPILLPEVRFAGLSARNVTGVIAPFPERIEQGEGISLEGFLGSGFCRPFRVTIDFSRMRVRLAVPEDET